MEKIAQFKNKNTDITITKKLKLSNMKTML